MKSILIISICFLYTGIISAQSENKDDNDTSHFKIGKLNFLMWKDPSAFAAFTDTSAKKKKKEEDHSHIPMLGLGINGYLNTQNSAALPSGYEFLKLNQGKSYSISFNCMEGKINLVNNYLHIVMGMDLEFNNYRFSGNYRISDSSGAITGYWDPVSLKKTKLTVAYLNFPIVLEINTHKKYKKSFHFQPGIISGIKSYAHTKVVYEAGGVTNKLKEYGDFNLSPFRYGVTLRIGYGGIQLFANYMFSELFEEIKDPLLYPFTVGVLIL